MLKNSDYKVAFFYNLAINNILWISVLCCQILPTIYYNSKTTMCLMIIYSEFSFKRIQKNFSFYTSISRGRNDNLNCFIEFSFSFTKNVCFLIYSVKNDFMSTEKLPKVS